MCSRRLERVRGQLWPEEKKTRSSGVRRPDPPAIQAEVRTSRLTSSPDDYDALR
jgi:hypothetical protein